MKNLSLKQINDYSINRSLLFARLHKNMVENLIDSQSVHILSKRARVIEIPEPLQTTDSVDVVGSRWVKVGVGWGGGLEAGDGDGVRARIDK